MINVAVYVYRAMDPNLSVIVKRLYSSHYKAALNDQGNFKQFNVEYRSLFELCVNACNFLEHPCLKISAKMSTVIVPQIRTMLCQILNCYSMRHNSFITAEDPRVLKRYLNDSYSRIVGNIKLMKALCRRLIKSSDFIHGNFLGVVVAVDSILYCCDRMFTTLKVDANLKSELIEKKCISGCVSVGIKSNSPLGSYNLDTLKSSVSLHDYIKDVDSLIISSGILDSYNKFLLCTLEENYGCSFDHLLDALAKASLMLPGNEVCPPETEVLVCNRYIKMVNRLSRVDCFYDFRTEDIKRVNMYLKPNKKRCLSSSQRSIDLNSLASVSASSVLQAIGNVEHQLL